VWWIDEVVVRGKVADLLKSVHCANALMQSTILQYLTVLYTQKKKNTEERTSTFVHQALKKHDSQSKFYCSSICNATLHIRAQK